MKLKWLPVAVFAGLLLMVSAVAVLAQEETEVPTPYAGLKNPFPWSDTSAQEAGKGLYQQSCLSCHGANGDSIAGADFSATDFPKSLEERPDFYFWILSEGRLDKGMPPFKSSLSEEQRWQALTYLWSLGAPPEVSPPPIMPPAEGGTLLLTAPEQAQSGQPLTLTATLQDNQGKPIRNATVKFFIKVDFFTSGLMEIGDAVTNDQGVAVFEYTPRQTGDTQVVARYEAIETSTTVSLAESDELFYRTEVGIQLPALGKEIFISPEPALEPESGSAPLSALRLPGGTLSWFLLLVAAVILIWTTYFRVMYQAWRISIVSEIEGTDTRLVPLIGMAVVLALGTLLVLMLITGPYSHLHVLR